MPVPDAKGALGRLHQPVHEIEPLRLRDPEPCVDAEQHQRCEPLCRRRHVVETVSRDGRGQGRYPQRLVPFQIGQRERGSGTRQVGGNRLRQPAAIKIIQPRPAQSAQRLRETRLAEPVPFPRRRSGIQVGFGEAGRILQFRKLAGRVGSLGPGNGDAVLGEERGLLEQPGQG